MSTFKKAEVILLPTNEVKGDFSKERIYPCLLKHSWMFDKEEKGKLIFANSNIRTPTQLQNLYIISDDEIKEDDWVYENNLNQETQIYQVYNRNNELGFFRFRNVWISLNGKQNSAKKIIATTDNSLELPQPSKQFIQKYIEEYNKDNVIEDVLVEYELISNEEYFGNTFNPDDDVPYFDERLKINPKDNTITIKKVKDSYSREEVIKLCKQAFLLYKSDNSGYPGLIKSTQEKENKWIEENL